MHIQHTPDIDDDINDIPPGGEVDDSVMDDAERDALAEAEEQRKLGEPVKDQETILAQMRDAMNGDLDEEGRPIVKDPQANPAKDKPPAKTEAKPEGEAPADDVAPDAQAAEDAAALAEEERKAAIEAEADTLKLKGKTKERFHELNDTIASQATRLAAYEALGEDPSAVAAEVVAHREFEDAIFAMDLSSTDFQNIAGYKAAINSDDPALWENARAFLLQELTWLETERMGIRAPDGKDLLEGHDDLLEKVNKGSLDRDDAEEIARLRNTKTKVTTAKQTAVGNNQESEARAAGSNACVNFAKEMSTLAPAEWAAKWPVLQPKVVEIQTKFPPDRWESEIALAYAKIPYKAQAAPVPRVGAQPVRGGGRPAGSAPREMQKEAPKDAFSALKEGFASVTPTS